MAKGRIVKKIFGEGEGLDIQKRNIRKKDVWKKELRKKDIQEKDSIEKSFCPDQVEMSGSNPQIP